MAIAEDIGCNNTECVEAPKCERTAIYENGTASAVKRFGGTADEGCGKFIPKREFK